MNRHFTVHKTARQQGFVLVTALILLLILTLLGLAAAQSTSMQEQMAGNQRNQALAFEAAEAGLSVAHTGVLQGLWTNAEFAANTNGLYTLATCCTGSVGYTSAWEVSGAWSSAIALTTPSPGLSSPQVAAQPVFLVEELPPVAPAGHSLVLRQSGGGPPVQPYRITVYAT
ncbi:MAG: pilus assembly PilX family protein, partial [Gammaproteobacteria bacterium]